MAYFSQRDSNLAKMKVGFGKMTFSQVGCAIVSIANLNKFYADSNLTPLNINDLAKKCGAFNVDMLNFAKLAKELGYSYEKWTPSHPLFKKLSQRVIAETNYYSKVGVPQHFFFYNPANNKRIDPLDLEPSWESNNYPIVSYRIFTKNEPVKEVKPKEVAKPTTPPKEQPASIPEQPDHIIEANEMVEPIKLAELPKIEEVTPIGEIVKLIKYFIKLWTKLK